MSKLGKNRVKGLFEQKAWKKKTLVLRENQTHDPLISSSDALYNELLETLG